MKRTFHLALLIGMAFLMIACTDAKNIRGSGKVVAKNIAVSAFDELNVNGDFIVNVAAGQSTPEVVLKTDDNLLPYVLTQSHENIFTLSEKPGYHLHPTTPIQVTVDIKTLKTVRLNGSTTLIVGGMTGDGFALAINGAGTSVLKGALNHLSIDVNGAAHVNAQGLKAGSVDVKIRGVAQTSVTVSKKLDVLIEGAGRVTYFGEPPVINQEIRGGGKVLQGAGD